MTDRKSHRQVDAQPSLGRGLQLGGLDLGIREARMASLQRS